MSNNIVLISLLIITTCLISIFVNIVIIKSGYITTNLDCGDWISYQDEKCFKVFENLTEFALARHICDENNAVLSTITSKDEQALIEDLLKNNKISNNVWIGIKRNNNNFQSVVGKPLKYTHWANGRPLNQTDVDCVEILVNDDYKWWDVKCEKKNAVLCEKRQQWSHSKIQNILVEIRKNFAERNNHLDAILEGRIKELDKLKLNQLSLLGLIGNQKTELHNLKQNPVPIGFIYIQLSGQSEPHTLWPQTDWENISVNYSGLFFRAEGNGSANFEDIQNEQTQLLQLTHINCGSDISECDDSIRSSQNAYTVTNNFNTKPFTMGKAQYPVLGMNFKYTTDEIRPRNQAIRIWIRIK